MDYKKELDKIHNVIHSLRLIDNYKISAGDRKIAAIIVQAYKGDCDECKQRAEAPPQQNKKNKLWETLLGE